MDPIARLRVLSKQLERTSNLERLLVLAEITERAQELTDEQLIAAAEERGGQETLARGLGITKQAVSQRVQAARRRRGHYTVAHRACGQMHAPFTPCPK